MKRLLNAALACALFACTAAYAQNSNTSAPEGSGNTNVSTTKKRGPVFRATKEQIKQAQEILKQRGLYGGEANGKLDTPTRDGLKKFQEAEGLKVTGTLNASTLQKMNVTLTDKQKEWVASQSVSPK